MFDPLEIINFYYPGDTPLRKLLLEHSINVKQKALEILDFSGLSLDRELISAGAMLHDVGVFRCHAPGIFCVGDQPYLTHGIIGGALLRDYGRIHHIDLESFARICERHTGSGLPAGEIIANKLPLPGNDFVPETAEEKLICLADKFFSKSGSRQEKSLERCRKSMEKFGPAAVARFDELCRFFHYNS